MQIKHLSAPRIFSLQYLPFGLYQSVYMYLTNALKNPKQDCLVVEAIGWWPRQNAKRFAMCKWSVTQMSHQISYSAQNASRINTGRSIRWCFAMCRALIFPQLSCSHLPPHEILCFGSHLFTHALRKISWRELYMYTLMWEHPLVSLGINPRASCIWSWDWFCTFRFFIPQLHTP